MSATPFIFDVSRDSFQTAVLDNSIDVPVLVDFWAAWCQPCRVLTPLLHKLAEEYQGAFLLAKVNADQEPALATQYGVRGLPTVKVFRNGQAMDELVGVQPESVYREAIERYRVKAADILLTKAEEAWRQGKQRQALEHLREAERRDPANPQVKIALAQLLLAAGEAEKAGEILHALPYEIRVEQPASGLLARLEFVDLVKDAPDAASLERAVATRPEDHELRRQLAARKALQGDFEGALQQFMEILRRDPQFDDGAGRKGMLAIFNLLGDDHPLTAAYRRRMFALLH